MVNKAKWLLISRLNMEEKEAHRHIERQAMDRCITKRDVAEEIIQKYRQ
ncbi:MAG: ANTAR domain-containing protein [Anaerovoracaceae bacterium]